MSRFIWIVGVVGLVTACGGDELVTQTGDTVKCTKGEDILACDEQSEVVMACPWISPSAPLDPRRAA